MTTEEMIDRYEEEGTFRVRPTHGPYAGRVGVVVAIEYGDWSREVPDPPRAVVGFGVTQDEFEADEIEAVEPSEVLA